MFNCSIENGVVNTTCDNKKLCLIFGFQDCGVCPHYDEIRDVVSDSSSSFLNKNG